PNRRVDARGLLVLLRPEERVGEVVLQLVRVRAVRVGLEVTPVSLRGQVVLLERALEQGDVALLDRLSAEALRLLVMARRFVDQRALGELLGPPLLDRVLPIGLPPLGALAVVGETTLRRQRALHLLMALPRPRDARGDLGGVPMVRPPAQRELPHFDRLGVLGFLEEDLAEPEVDFARPLAILRQELRILNALDRGPPALGPVRERVLGPVVAREG